MLGIKKRLDIKLERILSDPLGSGEFIIADAKDADMGSGLTAPGKTRGRQDPKGRWKTLENYREQIRDVISQDIVDIMLLSASNLEQLAIKEKLFQNSAVTPVARINDTTDIWNIRGGNYSESPSRSFQTATIDHIKYGQLEENHSKRVTGADLGLYSITFTNDLERDHQALEDFRAFRLEAERKHFRYFLEVFNPNVDLGFSLEETGDFLNDHIIRCLAGVTTVGRPLFLKIPYNGPRSMEDLVSYDPNLIVGILGGGAGTTMDAFQLIYEARKHGVRVALFGRKINLSEYPLAFIESLRCLADDEISPKEAVKAYHGVLQKHKIEPIRPLSEDLQLTESSLLNE